MKSSRSSNFPPRLKIFIEFCLIFTRSWNWNFITLVFILIGIDFRNWSDAVWPANDSIPTIQIFYSFYNELFFHGHLIRWLPFGNFGIQADLWQFSSLASADYLTAIVAAALRVPNALFVFKLSVFLEQLFLLFGSFCLAREIFRHKTTVFITSLSVIGSTFWLPQLYWNFRIYYLVPLIFYFLILFFKRERPHFLWLAGMTGVISMLGNIVYYIFICFPVMFLFVLVSWLNHRDAYRCLAEKSRANFFFLTLFVLTSAAVLYFAAHMMDHMISFNVGRDPITHASGVEDFLKSGEIGFDKFRLLFFPLVDERSGATLFIGLLPLPFLMYALIYVRNSVFATITTVTLFVLCFSLGDVALVARNLYSLFPPIRFFRYIGTVGGLLRLLFIIMAGFGLDHFLTSLKSSTALENKTHLRRLSCCGVFLFCLFCFVALKGGHGPFFYTSAWIKYHYFIWGIYFAGLFLLNAFSQSQRFARGMLIFFMALEILSYQQVAFATWKYKFPWLQNESTQVHAYQYQPQRSLALDQSDNRIKQITAVAEAGKQGFLIEMLSYLQIDPCLQRMYLNFYWSKDMDELISIRWPLYRTATSGLEFIKSPNVNEFLNIFGCQLPKVKLFSDAAIVHTRQELVKAIEVLTDINEKMVIEDPMAPEMASLSSTQDVGSSNVIAFNFNSIKIETNVILGQGAWLYYADAYHPGWSATIDGREAPVRRANLAFKAVKLDPGKHVVELHYFDGLQGVASYAIVFLSVIFSAAVLGYIFLVCIKRDFIL